MNHLSSEQIYAYLLKQDALLDDQMQHLANCITCRQELVHVERLLTELQVARFSQLTPGTQARYQQLFQHVQQKPSGLRGLVERLRATLIWDTRTQLAGQGVRNNTYSHYRLLYDVTQAEVEMLVTPRTIACEIEGEITPLISDDLRLPALIQLQPTIAATSYEAESNGQGRFHFDHVLPGRYTMSITPTAGALLEIDAIEIA
jgi:hypothetical protein